MVVGDAHIVRMASFPAENDAPLLVDADGMEPLTIPTKGLQAVPGRIAQMINGFSFMDGDEFVECTLLNLAGQFAGIFQSENLFRLLDPRNSESWRTLLESAYARNS